MKDKELIETMILENEKEINRLNVYISEDNENKYINRAIRQILVEKNLQLIQQLELFY